MYIFPCISLFPRPPFVEIGRESRFLPSLHRHFSVSRYVFTYLRLFRYRASAFTAASCVFLILQLLLLLHKAPPSPPPPPPLPPHLHHLRPLSLLLLPPPGFFTLLRSKRDSPHYLLRLRVLLPPASYPSLCILLS